MRVLGVDFGLKRIGIAVGESEPLAIALRQDLFASGSLAKDAQAISALARKEGAEVVIVGVPARFAPDSRMARLCAKLASEIAATGLEVRLTDESFSTEWAESELALRESKRSRRRKLAHSEAARAIVERFLETTDRG